jgi:hypothetical protein
VRPTTGGILDGQPDRRADPRAAGMTGSVPKMRSELSHPEASRSSHIPVIRDFAAFGAGPVLTDQIESDRYPSVAICANCFYQGSYDSVLFAAFWACAWYDLVGDDLGIQTVPVTVDFAATGALAREPNMRPLRCLRVSIAVSWIEGIGSGAGSVPESR